MDSFHELAVWQKAMDLVERIYSLTKSFPSEEKYSLISQIQRSAVSIPSNIAEGWGRSSTLEYLHFLKIARGSLYELETQIFIAERLKYITDTQTSDLVDKIEIIGKMLNNLIKSLNSKFSKS